MTKATDNDTAENYTSSFAWMYQSICNFFDVHTSDSMMWRLNRSFWEFEFWSEKCTKATEKN